MHINICMYRCACTYIYVYVLSRRALLDLFCSFVRRGTGWLSANVGAGRAAEFELSHHTPVAACIVPACMEALARHPHCSRKRLWFRRFRMHIVSSTYRNLLLESYSGPGGQNSGKTETWKTARVRQLKIVENKIFFNNIILNIFIVNLMKTATLPKF